MKNTLLLLLISVAGLVSCKRDCLPPGWEETNRKYYEEKSLNEYLLREDAAQKIFLVASGNNPSETDTSGYIKSFEFQHLIVATNDYKASDYTYANVKPDPSDFNKYGYKTTDYFYTDSLLMEDSVVIWYYGWRDFIDTTTGKFVRGDSLQVEYNTTWELGGSPVFGIYINNNEYKEVKLSRVTPKVIVANPQKKSDLKALARAYNWYLGKNYEGGNLFYGHE